MKLIILSSLLALSGFALAAPVNLEGTYSYSGEITPMSRILQQEARNEQEALHLKKEGYTCKRILSRYLCEKLESIENLSSNVAHLLKEMTPDSLSFATNSGDYGLTNDSEFLKEWSKNQEVQIDGVMYSQVDWREIKKNIQKVILSNSQSRLEFVWNSDSTLGSVQHVNDTNPSTGERAEYWGIVIYRK